MKTAKVVSITTLTSALSLLLFVSSASAFWENDISKNSQNQIVARGPGGQNSDMKGPGGRPQLDMTESEQQAYMEENKPEGAPEGGGQREGGQMDGTPPNMEDLPNDWDEMTDAEKEEYREENRPERDESEKVGQQNRTQKQTRNLTRKALQGKNYSKFTGQLKTKKQFTDENDMENPELISFLQQRGIMEGYSDGSFGAENPINRAESLKVLLESLGIDPESGETDFSDIDKDAWYAGYVNAAKSRGFVKGYSDGTFKPGNTVNHAELLKISFESFGIDLTDYDVTDLPDGIDESAWFAPYLQYALDNELLNEEDISLSDGMTREMFAEVVARLIQQQESLE